MSSTKLQQPRAISSVFYYTVFSVLVGKLNCLPSQQKLPSNYRCASVKPRPSSFSLHISSMITRQLKMYSNNRTFFKAHHQSHLFSQGVISLTMNIQYFSTFFSTRAQTQVAIYKVFGFFPLLLETRVLKGKCVNRVSCKHLILDSNGQNKNCQLLIKILFKINLMEQ